MRSASSTTRRSIVGRAADEDGERVAVEPRDDVARLRTEPSSRAATPRSSSSPIGVPERVVDALEVVEVDDHHGDLARRARLERLAHLLAEQRAVASPVSGSWWAWCWSCVLQVAQLGDGVLEAVELQRGARVGGQRLEQGAVAVR